MALTKGFADGQGTPDKHIANFGVNNTFPSFPSDNDTNASGQVPDSSGGDTNAKARANFARDDGPPAAPRVAGVAAQAAATAGLAGTTNENQAFIDGSTFGTARKV